MTASCTAREGDLARLIMDIYQKVAPCVEQPGGRNSPRLSHEQRSNTCL